MYCTIDIVELLCGKEARKRFRIIDISHDILDQVARKIRASPAKIISFQVDESTDVSNCVHLWVYSWYVHVGKLNEEFLTCESLEATTKAVDILKQMDFFERNDLSLNNVGSLYTDGAPAMIGAKSGFVALAKKRAPH